jgi:hypothetical protein
MKRYTKLALQAAAASILLTVAQLASTRDPPTPNLVTTSFLDFEAPPNWSCNVESSTWVCQDTRPDRQHESIIIFAAKQVGPGDDVDVVLANLRRPKTWRAGDGGVVVSQVISARKTNIAGQTWVDAVHDDSEVPGFRTRYLFTVKGGLAALVTMSAKRERYAALAGAFDDVARSLRLKDVGRDGG